MLIDCFVMDVIALLFLHYIALTNSFIDYAFDLLGLFCNDRENRFQIH